ncbi:MAG: sugar phosphate isomerase/epimerase family protein [Nitrospirota bacterium]
MSGPHVHVPYGRIRDYIDFAREHRLNLEIFFSAADLVSCSAPDLRALMGELGYGPSLTVHAPFMDLAPAAVDPGVREVTAERFDRALDAAGVLEAKAVVFHSGYDKWKYGHNMDIWLQRSLGFWPRFIGRARDLGTRIAVENIFEDTPENLKLLMEGLGSESFGICFDTGHMNIFSLVPLDDWLDALGEHIIELHLHDNRGDLDAHLPVGEGDFDFDSLFARLAGRNVIRTVEATSPQDVLTSLDRLRKYS